MCNGKLIHMKEKKKSIGILEKGGHQSYLTKNVEKVYFD